MALPISSDRAGHIVAVEGPADLVSTQLRLLPPSHQILILPSLQHYLRDADPDAPFDPRGLILRYHTAAQARHTEAVEFLRPPTLAGEKRLVLMHGGTMSAQVSCLSTIMEHESDDDIEEAHATLVRLSTHGVAGLSGARLSYHQVVDTLPSVSAGEREGPKSAASDEGQRRQDVSGGYRNTGDTIEDRIIRAMKAADALDKETEFLQPVTPDVDLTVKLVDIPSRSKKRLSSTVVDGSDSLRDSRPPSPPHHHQARRPAEPLPRVSLNARSAGEPTSTAPRKPPLRIRIPSPPIPWAGDVAANGDRHSPKVFQPQRPVPVPEGSRHRRSQTLESNLSPRQVSTSGDSDGLGVPNHESQGRSSPQEGRKQSKHPEASQPTETEERPFETVLPLLEDLVVYFTPETPNELHNFVFRRLSEGCKSPRLSVPGSDIPQHGGRISPGARHLRVGESHEGDHQSEDAHAATPWMRKDLVHGLPTPNHSPNPLDTSSVPIPPVDTRLYSISVDQETAVSIQNFLRSFLASQFPLQGRRFSTAEGAEFSPEAGLWRPFECDGQVGSPGGESRLDLILAVGAESGVTKNRLSEVVGQLEKLGFKTSGLSRSGRLDIRYLIANAMQAFTAQPLTKQTQSNPFADRALLAALIIPHVETYLATHLDVRFLLIEYPSEHLPTVLALQTLIGTDRMKVVGIIDSDASSSLQSLSVPDTDRRPSEGFRSLNRRGSRLSGAFVGPCSFSKANFLLASSATGFETAAFVAAIRESLISISDYYIPERPLYKHPLQSSPRKAHQSVGRSTKTASTISAPSRKETSRLSVSTLIITPPSSPTESSPPAQTQPQHGHHINPRNIPPRSSSSTASPPRGPHPSTTTTPSTAVHIRWGEINYAPSTPTQATRPLTGSALVSSGSTTTTTTNNNNPHRPRHRHQDSDPLSPRGSAPSPPAPPPHSSSSSSAAAAAVMNRYHRGGDQPQPQPPALDDSDSDIDDDSVPDAEERRLMPLYLRRREEIERGRSSKAWRWLGLA